MSDRKQTSLDMHRFWYVAKVVRVVDGDTVDFDMDLGLYLTKRERLRLAGLNAPEVRGPERKDGLESQAWLEARLPVGKTVLVHTYKDKKGKYGRYMADIWDGDTLLNRAMIEAGMAEEREY